MKKKTVEENLLATLAMLTVKKVKENLPNTLRVKRFTNTGFFRKK